MKVALSLVLDLLGQVKLDLYEGTLKEVDEFVTDFTSHEQIRENPLFEPAIERFLNENKSLTDSFKAESNKKGRIMITYIDENNNCHAIPVVYSKDIRFLNEKYDFKLFKEHLLANPKDLKELAKKRYYLFSQFELSQINYALRINNPKKYEEVIKMIIRSFKGHKDPYFYVRSFLSSYRDLDKPKKLPDEIKTSHGMISRINEEIIPIAARVEQLGIEDLIANQSQESNTPKVEEKVEQLSFEGIFPNDTNLYEKRKVKRKKK